MEQILIHKRPKLADCLERAMKAGVTKTKYDFTKKGEPMKRCVWGAIGYGAGFKEDVGYEQQIMETFGINFHAAHHDVYNAMMTESRQDVINRIKNHYKEEKFIWGGDLYRLNDSTDIGFEEYLALFRELDV